MNLTAVWVLCVVICHATAQYGPIKGKKHRTTTTTTESPGAISNEISGPFPVPSGSKDLHGGPPSPESNNYWWRGPDSPFKPGGHSPDCGETGCAPSPHPGDGIPPPPPPPPAGGCGGPAGCTGVGTDPRPAPSEPFNKPVDIAQNPFLSSALLGKPIQQSPQGCQGAGGSCQYPQQGTGPTQYPGAPTNPGQPPKYPSSSPGSSPGPTQYPSKPPGQYPGQHSGTFPGQSTGPTQYPGPPSSPFPGQGTGPTQYPGQPTNPSGPTQYPGQPTNPSGPNQYPGQPTNPSGPNQYPGQPTNPSGPNQYPGQPTYPSGPNQYPGQPTNPSSPNQYPGQPTNPSGPNQYPGQPTNPSGPNQYPGQPTNPSGPNQYPGLPSPPGSTYPSVPLRPQCSAAGHACVPSSSCVGGVITPHGMRQLRDPQVKECIPGLEACCRLPPGHSSPAPGPVASQQPYTGPLNTTPHPGCAAALKCVAESYCTAEGVMSDSPVILTREQADNKVPLSDCQDLETGIIGKCCRDPNYKDPWPAGMMMKNPGDFDDGQYHGEGSGPGANYNTVSSTPQAPSKDHGPKPGGFNNNKPFPPPFPGNNPTNPSYQPGRPQPSNIPYQPTQPPPSGSPYQPGQPSGSPYQPGQPSPTGHGQPYQPGQPKPGGIPYQPGQPRPTETLQPPHSIESPNQPNHPSGTPYQPGQPAPTGPSFQPGQPIPSGSPYQPSQPSSTPFQPDQPSGSPYQPGQPSSTPFHPDEQSPTGQQPDYNLPTHPGQNQPSGNTPQDQGPPPGTSCGIRRPGPIGDVAGFAEFPWHALVVSAGNRSLLCGAAIVAENAVITAAHCVNKLGAAELLVKAGEWKLLGQNPKPVQVRPVAAVARHPGYDSASLAKDLAILVLSQPFNFDTHVDKICIPPEIGSEYFQQPGQNCLITGWGKNALAGPIPDSDLHKVDVNVIPAKQCEAKLKTSQNLGKYFILNEGFSCALPPSPTDLCKVDFGSAVACKRGDGHYELAGVNSWDIACVTKQPLPSVFATSDAQWINTVLSTPTPVLQTQEQDYSQSLNKGESVEGVDVEDKPGFSQGYGK